MKSALRRIFVEKKSGFDVEAKQLLSDLKQNLSIKGLDEVRILNRYDISGISEDTYLKALNTIFSQPNTDIVYEEKIETRNGWRVFGIEYLPGQYDQRADSAVQCVEILAGDEMPVINTAKIIILKGNITDEEFKKIKHYCINPVDSREAGLTKPENLEDEIIPPRDVETVEGFIKKSPEELVGFKNGCGLAMSLDDIKLCQEYFAFEEKRNPTVTEIRVIDTYWSDHCRHTTFNTKINSVEFDKGIYCEYIKRSYQEYLDARKYVYGNNDRDICLMDMAVIGMKELKKRGLLEDLDDSEEINACSINVDVDVDGRMEKWLVMFKNETHNHPTEIEPFGGAATCLGGAIRDPLSGRAYVYQAMRVTGCGDPRVNIKDTLPGKLPQRKITTAAAQGYSSYGNQIGIATGHVCEIYDERYVAKRMEIGAVIGATPKENVIRRKPQLGDLVILIGGRTGRDGCGGATGSSKSHTNKSLLTCGSEVQKGNAPTERKLLRLFRNPRFSKIVKRCNDFGAGGISVAVGELTSGLVINLDNVLKKYEGLNGTELAISESQERMAVVINREDLRPLMECVDAENLEAAIVGRVTDDKRLKIKWRNKQIVDIDRRFLDINGARRSTGAYIKEPDINRYFDTLPQRFEADSLKNAFMDNLRRLNVASQKGLVERFDSTIGAGTILMPFGGRYQLTPSLGMAAKIPVLKGETNTCTIMSYGFDPGLSAWSPFHGGMYAVIDSVAKIVAMGGDPKNIRLSLQEYFEKLTGDEAWGRPLSALLGAYEAQRNLKIAAIGGKDSMSGSFNDLSVPPTLVSFAVCADKAENIISPEFKKTGNQIVVVKSPRNKAGLPDFKILNKNFSIINNLIKDKRIFSAYTVGIGGIAASISKMAFGNKIGMVFTREMPRKELFTPDYGSIILEIDEEVNLEVLLKNAKYETLGYTDKNPVINVNGTVIDLDTAVKAWEEPLCGVFPIRKSINDNAHDITYQGKHISNASFSAIKPRVFIPVFPGTNCEYDMKRVFEKAGGDVEIFVFKNLTPHDIKDSIKSMTKKINNSCIIALPGGFSAGDEPDGSGKFIAAVFRNPYVVEAVMELLNNRDGLILGICNGFQALIKLGLLPYGEIRETDEESPTLTFNKIGRHISRMVRTKVVSNLSPWLKNTDVGDVFTIPISHGEGRLVSNKGVFNEMKKNGQIATQYVDPLGNASYNGDFNPNGSYQSIEGITSPDGRIFGKMGHSERIGGNLYKNITGRFDQKLFEAGIDYFK